MELTVPLLYNIAVGFFAVVGLLAVSTYLLPCLVQGLFPTQNLRKKYDASWALVTGGSSGIGLAISERLASDGVNVVIAALDDDLLKSSVASLRAKYPKLKFRPVGVNLAGKDYMAKIIEATKDVDIAMVFNNAGYIKPGLFSEASIESIMANFDVNASCTIPITHHFVRRMLARKKRSLVCFTSSSAGFLAAPMTGIYNSTKNWMTNFGASLAGELLDDKIDVLVVHPSPIATNFYKNSNGVSVIQSAEKSAANPS
eukprot:jgi/Hompol1/2775/HPOL_006157-RA